MDSPKQVKPMDIPRRSNTSPSSMGATSDAMPFHSMPGMQSHSPLELNSLKLQSPLSESPRRRSQRDSAFSEASSPRNSPSSSRRASTSTSTSRRDSPSKSKRRISQTSTYSSRPPTKRATASSPQTAQIKSLYSFHSHRPSLNSRYTIPYLQSTSTPSSTNTANQFFQFPSLPIHDSSPPQQPHHDAETPLPPPMPQQPPPTVQYWTSDSTRRLEYAAIDAASRGLRGFVIKLIPDCMLPPEMRRTRFCDGDEGSDAGSVRRYRLELPGEEDEENQNKAEMEEKRSGILRRWTGGFRSRTTTA